jgi:hypothetical protein
MSRHRFYTFLLKPLQMLSMLIIDKLKLEFIATLQGVTLWG